jgi:diguanylate cyclase (GGDEF)-like protein
VGAHRTAATAETTNTGRKQNRSYRWTRLASLGMVLMVLVLAAMCVVGGVRIHRASTTVSHASTMAGAYVRADEAIAAEISLERQYRLRPDPAVRAEYYEEGEVLAEALEVIEGGDRTDRALVAELRSMHRAYDEAIRQMFDAVDAGDIELVNRLDVMDVQPAFERLDVLVDDAAEEHTEAADEAVLDLRRIQAGMYLVLTVGFTLGLIVAVGLGAVLRRYNRRLVEQAQNSQHQAMHDALTGLPNRALFADRVGQALADARRRGTRTAVLLLDLDRFKEVNDTLGHHYGDELLNQVAARLQESFRESDTVARLAGDEFAVLLPGAEPTQATELAHRALRSLEQTFMLGDVTVDIETSIGVATAPEHAEAVEDLLRCADLAMYSAKDTKTGVVVFEPSAQVNQPSRLVLLGDLRRALQQQDQLHLHYQPKVGLHENQLCGVEALVRWQHPTRGNVPPDEFIPIAESTGLINRLTTLVLELAAGQARAWLDDGLEVPVAVNLSPRCLLDAGFVDRVRDLLAAHRLPARLLRLEVTESAVMTNPALAMSILTSLHDLGIRLSIDDYGTGYSSMAYLKQLPVDELKVDRTFVMNMATSDNDAVLVRGAIELGHNLGLSVVAEGVEKAEDVVALNEFGCDVAQGYHYARPMPPGQVRAWLQSSGVGHADTAPAVPVEPQASGVRAS